MFARCLLVIRRHNLVQHELLHGHFCCFAVSPHLHAGILGSLGPCTGVPVAEKVIRTARKFVFPVAKVCVGLVNGSLTATAEQHAGDRTAHFGCCVYSSEHQWERCAYRPTASTVVLLGAVGRDVWRKL